MPGAEYRLSAAVAYHRESPVASSSASARENETGRDITFAALSPTWSPCETPEGFCSQDGDAQTRPLCCGRMSRRKLRLARLQNAIYGRRTSMAEALTRLSQPFAFRSDLVWSDPIRVQIRDDGLWLELMGSWYLKRQPSNSPVSPGPNRSWIYMPCSAPVAFFRASPMSRCIHLYIHTDYWRIPGIIRSGNKCVHAIVKSKQT